MKTITKKIKIDNPDGKTFFAMSDIHGDYFSMLLSLKLSGFDETNKNHIMVVAGDIIEGDSGMEDAVLAYLKLIDEQDRLIAVLGNHDTRYIGSKYDKGYGLKVPYRDGTTMSITKNNWDWLKTLPIAIKTQHFNVVHGMWNEDAFNNATASDVKFMLNASPANIGTIEYNKNFGYKYPYSSKQAYIDTLIKPTLNGHFYKYLYNEPLSTFQDELGNRLWHEPKRGHINKLNKGAFKIGNLIMLDNHVKVSKNLDIFKFKLSNNGHKIKEIKS